MTSSQETEIIATVLNYLDGIAVADAARINDAFYSSVNLSSTDDNGNLVLTPKDALIAYATGPDIPQNKGKIEKVEVIKNMAFVKARIDLPEYQFVDFLTLLRLNTGWKIVSKTYTTIHP